MASERSKSRKYDAIYITFKNRQSKTTYFSPRNCFLTNQSQEPRVVASGEGCWGDQFFFIKLRTI